MRSAVRCPYWHSDTDSQFAAFSFEDIADAYHHMAVDHADTYYPVHAEPSPSYYIALWDPGCSSNDSFSLPDLVSDSSIDGYMYDNSSSEESIPAQARYDVDSEIDDCRLGDRLSPDPKDELWNAEF